MSTLPASTFATAVYIGRFQPVHNGHLALLQHALHCARQVVVVIGSAGQSRSPKNPFTWQEREAMLRATLSANDNARLHIVAVRDYYNETRWVRAVKEGVDALLHTLKATNASDTPAAAPAPDSAPSSVALVGHFKDASSYYLRAFAPWTLLDLPRQGDIDATAVRAAYWGAHADGSALALSTALQSALAPMTPLLPASTIEFLQGFAQEPAYTAMQAEWRMVQGYRAAWANAPYPPVFVTVDALLRCNDHVLLIRRAHSPGKGLLALPGGFIEQRETLWQSCLRELTEETHCDTPAEVLAHALQSTAVFDHPDRSQRGRTITHAFYIDLGASRLPDVQADDDAQAVLWVPLNQILSRESELFEDHFHILDHFLNLTTAP